MHIEIFDYDSHTNHNPSELIDRFAINVTVPINESTERKNYPGIFGLADIDVSFDFCTSCELSVPWETTDYVDTSTSPISTNSALKNTTESDLVTAEGELMIMEVSKDRHLERIIAPVFVIFLSLITVIAAVVVGVYMCRRAKRTSMTSKPSQVVRSSYENGENSHTVQLEDIAHNYDVLTAVSSHTLQKVNCFFNKKIGYLSCMIVQYAVQT